MSKRTLRHEKRLIRLLNTSRTPKLIKKIIAAETRKRKQVKAKKLERPHEIPTASNLQKDQFTGNELPRVASANQMVVFPVEEKGPGINQITRSILTETSAFPQKKNIFKIVIKENLEEKYKSIVDYNNLLILKSKETLKPQIHKLPPINNVTREALVNEVGVTFSFSEYKSEILKSYNTRYSSSYHTRNETRRQRKDALELILPIPLKRDSS